LIGYWVDMFGNYAILSGLLVPVLLIIVHSLLGFTSHNQINAIIPMVGQGIAYTIFAASFWPIAVIIVPVELVGTAYGILFAAQSIGLALVPLIIAWIYDSSKHQYIPNVELCFVCISIMSFIFGICINYYRFDLNNKQVNNNNNNNNNNNICNNSQRM